jgi:gas vesicle protein
MKNLISRIQRELPDTDKDRYDVAHERGKSEVRGGLLFGGLAFGAIVGAALTFLFDPNRGSDRRAQLASRATDLRNDLVRTASSRVEELQNRTKGPAVATAEPAHRAPEEVVPAPSTTRRTGQRSKASRGTSNGTPVAGLPLDDDSPGANVPDPLKPQEIEQFGASGPIAGATLTSADTQAGWEAAEREAQRASEGHAAG